MKKTFLLALILALAAPALAVVPSSASRIEYTANGVTTAFTFTFVTYAASHVEVYVAGVKQVAGYTVSLNANQSSSPGGTVTFDSPPAALATVRIQRTVPLTQDTVYTPYSAFPAKTTEKALDRMAMLGQQLQRQRDDDVATQDARDDDQDVQIALGPGVANGNNVPVTATGSTTARSLAARFADVVNVKDFGAVGDGVTDDTAAITAADTAGTHIDFGSGTYIVSTALAPSAGRTWFSRGRATIKRKANTNIRLIDTSASNVTLDGLTLDGNKANQAATSGSTAYGVVFSGGNDITVRNCTITGFARYSLRFDRSSRVVVTGNTIDGGEGASGVSSNTFLWATDSGVVAEDVRVTNNTFVRPEASPYWGLVQFQPYPSDQRAKKVLFANNVIRMPYAVAHINALGVELARIDQFSVTGNVVTGGVMGISVAASTSGAIAGNHLEVGDGANATAFNANHKAIEITDATDIAVTGNTIDGRTHLVSGIRADTTNARISIVGNVITRLGSYVAAPDAGPWGVAFANSTHGVIADNVIDGNATAAYGIYVNTATGVVVRGNVVRNLLATAYGIRAYASSNVDVQGNHLSGAPDYPIYLRNVSNFTVTGNDVAGGDTWGIYAEQTDGTSTTGSITGNLVAGAYASAGILLKEVPRVSIIGNTVDTTAGYAIALQQSSTSMPYTLIRANILKAPNSPPLLATVSAGGLGTTSYVEWTWTSAPAGGANVVGMTVLDQAAAESGTAGSKYVRTGWRCVTAGTPGTWVEMRALTGN